MALLTTLVGVVGCAGPPQLQSQSASTPPTIDGAIGDWTRGVTPVEGQPLSMGVITTDSMLYVAVTSSDRRVTRAVMQKGLIAWIDPAGGTATTYGVQYPLGRREEAQRRGTGAASRDVTDDERAMALRELAVRRGEERFRQPAAHGSGLRAQVQVNGGAFVYELAVPLVPPADSATAPPEALVVTPGSSIGVGMQTPSSDDERPPLQPRTGTSVTGDVTGQRRRGRRRRDNRRRQQAPDAQDRLPDLKVWTRVVAAPGATQ